MQDKMKIIWFIQVLFHLFHNIDAKCLPSETTCTFTFIVEERLTMHWYKTRVEAHNGSLYRFDEHPDKTTSTTQVPVDEVITMDGVPRSVIVVNNTVPGPTIVAYEGQEVIVHVINKLMNEAVTIHWHGMHQPDTPFMDGVPYVTQCPIVPGQLFTYKFKAYPTGTFLYHSHVDGQRVDGLFGAIIVKAKPTEISEPDDLIMTVGDWFHDKGAELHAKMLYANFKTQPGFIHPQTLDGVKYAPIFYKSSHIEGRGRYKDPKTGQWTGTPLKVYNVHHGKEYRFRVIGVGMLFPYRISVDGHKLLVVASDGFEFEPTVFESIIINPGERFDFIITANQLLGNYWIRAETLEVGYPDHNAKAILRYDEISNEDPKTSRITCTKKQPCKVLNCQFQYYPEKENTICVTIDQLKSVNVDPVPKFEDDSEEYFFNFVSVKYAMSVNGYKLEHTPYNSLTENKNVFETNSCDKCTDIEGCVCHNEITIPFNKTIQMIWTNHGRGSDRHHPIHLHGHSFHVLKVGYGVYNKTTGLKTDNNRDIDCIGEYCYNTKWTNPSWRGDDIPGLKLKDVPQKDTLMIPAGSYAVVRIRSNNPGKWLMHCHIEFHAMLGMSMIINEAPDHHPRLPSGFPVCHNFYNDAKKDKKYEEKGKDAKDSVVDIILYTLLAVFIVENIFMFVYCMRRRRKQEYGSGQEMNKIMKS